MTTAKIKIIKKKSMVYVDRTWFPYRNIVDTTIFDDCFCQEVESAIAYYGKRKVIVWYGVRERDEHNRPIKILVGFSIKGQPHEWCKYWFNTIYHDKLLTSRFTFGDEYSS